MEPHQRILVGDQTQKQLFEAIFQHATMGILITQQNGQIVLANKFALEGFGYNQNELLGKTVESLIPKRFHHHHSDYRQDFNAHATTRAMGAGRDLFGLRKDGTEFPVEVSLSPIRTGDQLLVIAFIIDITVRKEKERAEKEYENALLSLNKEKELNEMKSRFISMASHEFKTPLATILSSATLIAKYPKESEQPQREKHVDRIKSSVVHLNSTLNEFLDFGQIEHGNLPVHFSHFDLEELLLEIIQEVESSMGRKRDIQLSRLDAIKLYSDRHLLKNILINLVTNAIKFSPDHSVVSILCHTDKAGTSIAIQDAGVGIAPEDAAKIYNLFYRGNNVLHIKGTGLGLAIVHRYIELLDATLNFTSELNKGTTFTLSIKHEENTTDRG